MIRTFLCPSFGRLEVSQLELLKSVAFQFNDVHWALRGVMDLHEETFGFSDIPDRHDMCQ